MRSTPLALSAALLGGALAGIGCAPFDEVGDCLSPCVGDTLCIGTTCEPAFPRTYTMTLAVSMATRDPNGQCWDEPFCGEPDPFAVVKLDGVEIGRTPEQSGSFASWPGRPFTLTLDRPRSVSIEIFDSDVDVDDFAARCEATPVTAADLRRGRLSCPTRPGESSISADLVAN